jgi:NAD(P)-dependent dehydrogenase (short-subunit alcohol dehydrogenase family)
MGSIGLVKSYSFAPTHAYKVSKAALNMLTAQYAVDFEKRDFTFLAISPGVRSIALALMIQEG